MKRVFALITALMVAVLSCVPAFAAPQDESDFEWKPLVSLTSWDSSAATFIWSLPGLAKYRAAGNNCVLYPYIVMTGGTLDHIGYIDPSGLGTNHVWENGTSFAIASDPSRLDASLPSTISYGIGRKNTSSGAFTFNEDIPRFSSDKAALLYFVDNDPSTVYYSSSFRIPSGYVAYVKGKSGSSFTMTANYGFNSVAFADDWGQTGQVMTTGVSSLPSSGTKFPLSGMYKIPFQRSENRNLLGQSKVGVYSSTFQGSGYYVIYNPYYMKDFTNLYGSAFELNPSIILTASSISYIRLYPLSQTFDGATSDDWGSESLSDYEDYIDGSVDEEGNPVYQDQSGTVVAPPTDGGTNQVVTPVTNQSIIDRVTSIFNDLISKITSVFTEGYQAIVSLVGLAGPFFSKLSSLYSWLPAPVLSCLSSAMILAVTIGILRAFL